MIKMYNSLPMPPLWCNAVTCAVSFHVYHDGLTVMATDNKVQGFHSASPQRCRMKQVHWFTDESTQENKTVTINTKWSEGVAVAPSPAGLRQKQRERTNSDPNRKYKTDRQKKRRETVVRMNESWTTHRHRSWKEKYHHLAFELKTTLAWTQIRYYFSDEAPREQNSSS